jgi:hypothetical protein
LDERNNLAVLALAEGAALIAVAAAAVVVVVVVAVELAVIWYD